MDYRIIFLVARETIRSGILKGHRRMAFLAFNQSVVPQQQELGHGVVLERGRLPILLIMATFAFLALLAFVLVIFFMTRNTGRFQLVFIHIAFVTTRALQGWPMFAQ
jgi:hypothetical protein